MRDQNRAPSTSVAFTAQTPEQRRATDAQRAAKALDPNDELRKKYRAYVERIGPSILMNGLGQAVATERAAAGSEPPKKADAQAHERLYQNLQAWLCRVGGVYEPTASDDVDLLNAIVQGSEDDYLRAQVEALAWIVWHKKFCRAYLPPSEPEDD